MSLTRETSRRYWTHRRASVRRYRSFIGLTRGEALGDFIMSRAEEIGVSVPGLASSAGISESTIYQILRGDITCPPRRRLAAIARELNVPLADLFEVARRDGCEYDVE